MTGILSKEEEFDLGTKYRESKDITVARDAYQTLVDSQIGWAKTLMVRYCEGTSWWDTEEAESACYLGLCKAVDRFDPRKGRLSTLVTPYVRGELRQAHRLCGNAISLPNGTISETMVLPKCQSLNGLGDASQGKGATFDIPMEERPEATDVEVFGLMLLSTMLSKAKEEDVELLSRVYRDDLSFQEIADEDGVTKQAVHGRVARAHERLLTIADTIVGGKGGSLPEMCDALASRWEHENVRDLL